VVPVLASLEIDVEPHYQKYLERLCRYITRPALATGWMQCNAAGQVVAAG
jgi:hypothetical protein